VSRLINRSPANADYNARVRTVRLWQGFVLQIYLEALCGFGSEREPYVIQRNAGVKRLSRSTRSERGPHDLRKSLEQHWQSAMSIVDNYSDAKSTLQEANVDALRFRLFNEREMRKAARSIVIYHFAKQVQEIVFGNARAEKEK
jgi:hypothetical protein